MESRAVFLGERINMTGTKRRVLVIGAHPDDVEIACGGTLAKMHQAGYMIFELVLTQGERGGQTARRAEGTRRAAVALGVDRLAMLDFADTRLTEQALPVLDVIEINIREFKPDILLTHSAHDLHQDHVAVHEAALRAARDQGTILCYESPSATADFRPLLYVNVGGYVEIKIRSVHAHQDQCGKAYFDPKLIHAKLVFRGSQARVDFAEAFEVVRILSSDLGGV